MTSPVVESVRTIPLIVEKGQNHIPMEIEHNSGFPFEGDSDREGHFRSQLDDIAKRHPEFAEHLGNFSRRRQSSGDGGEDFHRRFERPFGSHFDRFSGFPFDREDFDPEQYAQQFYQQKQPEFQQQPQSYQHQQSYQPQPSDYQQPPQQGQPQYSQQPQYTQPQYSQPQYVPPQEAENPSNPEGVRSNIQQSSTIDLGQKQEPVNERNQRSMSAPPGEKPQRFTSSINIPVNQPNEGDNMAQTQSPDSKTTERIIPIHIEGRDEPVVPKSASPTYSQPHQSFSPGPQPERIFGQRPEHFTQFVNREPRRGDTYDTWHRPGFETRHQGGFSPEELLRQQRFPQQNVPPFYQQQQRTAAPPQQQQQQHVPPQQQQQLPKEDIPIPVQREVPHTKQQAPPQQQQQAAPPQQPPQPTKPKTPIEQIQEIQKDVSLLIGQVERFSGKPKDKQYLYLDEMLTRNLLKLDNVDTQGQDSIRSARKEAIKCIEKTISVLEAKAASNVETPKTEENMDVEQKSQDATAKEAEQTEVQTMETEPVAATETQQEPMEFSPATQDGAVTEEQKKEEEKPATENAHPEPVVENRAVLVTTENKEPPTVAEMAEPMETKEDTPVEAAAEPKPAEEPTPAGEEKPLETCEGQEKNLAVADAVKKFEGKEEEKPKEEAQQEGDQKTETEGEKKTEDKKEEKKDKKKGKKKAEKKEK